MKVKELPVVNIGQTITFTLIEMKGEKLFTKYLQCCTSYSVVVVTMNKVTRQQAFNSGCGLPSINLFSMPQELNRKKKSKPITSQTMDRCYIWTLNYKGFIKSWAPGKLVTSQFT